MDDLIAAVRILSIFFSIKSTLRSISISNSSIYFKFDISKVNNYPSRLQPENLAECNRLEIQRQVNDPILLEQLLSQARNLIKNSFAGRYVKS